MTPTCNLSQNSHNEKSGKTNFSNIFYLTQAINTINYKQYEIINKIFSLEVFRVWCVCFIISVKYPFQVFNNHICLWLPVGEHGPWNILLRSLKGTRQVQSSGKLGSNRHRSRGKWSIMWSRQDIQTRAKETRESAGLACHLRTHDRFDCVMPDGQGSSSF